MCFVDLPFQYKLLCTTSSNIEVYEEPMPRTKKVPHCLVEFEAGEENRIVRKFVMRNTYIGAHGQP